MFLYNFFILLYGLAIRNASITKPKARQWILGRKNWRQDLQQRMQLLGNTKRVWVHCASYGEFEQGRPLMEAIRDKNPELKIILSFFSPSGYEVFKDWKGADVICYLPLDTPANAEDFLEIVKPSTVIFIKYEFWLNFLQKLKKKKISTYLVSATFKPHHPFFKFYGSIFRKSLSAFKLMFIQDENSAKLLNDIGIHNHQVCGDTRFDRVLQIKENFKVVEGIEAFKGKGQLIVAGSTWAKDEDLVLAAFVRLKNTALKLILAPHDIEEKLLAHTVQKLKNLNLRYCLFTEGIDPTAQVIVLNTVGVLSRIYHYADCTYVGGGFNEGLHNILEPAVYGNPVTFYGDRYINFNEAVDIFNMKAGCLVKNEQDLAEAFAGYLGDQTSRTRIKADLERYFEKNSKVSEKVVREISL